MNTKFQLDIITPINIQTFTEVSYLRIPSIDGLVGIQAKHTYAIIALDIGEIKITDNNGNNIYFATSGGFADIKPEGTQLLLETIEEAQNIDKKRAQDSYNRANKRLDNKQEDLNRTKLSLKKAKNRLKIISRI